MLEEDRNALISSYDSFVAHAKQKELDGWVKNNVNTELIVDYYKEFEWKIGGKSVARGLQDEYDNTLKINSLTCSKEDICHYASNDWVSRLFSCWACSLIKQFIWYHHLKPEWQLDDFRNYMCVYASNLWYFTVKQELLALNAEVIKYDQVICMILLGENYIVSYQPI